MSVIVNRSNRLSDTTNSADGSGGGLEAGGGLKVKKAAFCRPASLDRHVPFYRHSLGPDYASLLASVLASPFLTSGPRAEEVEAQLKAFFEVRHAKLTSSWTQGAVATLLALGIGPGDEVIVPAMTFVATANVVKLVGGTPVFVDVDPETLLIDLERVRGALTARTRAIIPVHLYGQMLDTRALRAVVGANIRIIEDAAHCFEGTLSALRPGEASDAAVFSFYATKNVTCGEGGAVITNDDALMQALVQTILHGMSAGAAKRFENGRYRHWDVARLGTKANLPDLLAVLLGPQIASVSDKLLQREALAQRYDESLAGSPFKVPRIAEGAVSARHLYPIYVPHGQRDLALQLLNDRKIGATVNYRSVTDLELYRDLPQVRTGSFEQARTWGEGTLSLPLFPGLTGPEQGYVIEVLLNEVAPRLGKVDQNANGEVVCVRGVSP